MISLKLIIFIINNILGCFSLFLYIKKKIEMKKYPEALRIDFKKELILLGFFNLTLLGVSSLTYFLADNLLYNVVGTTVLFFETFIIYKFTDMNL